MSVDDYKKDHSRIQDLQMEQHMSKKPRRNHAPAFKAKVAVPRDTILLPKTWTGGDKVHVNLLRAMMLTPGGSPHLYSH